MTIRLSGFDYLREELNEPPDLKYEAIEQWVRAKDKRIEELEAALQWCIDNGGWRLFYYGDNVPDCFDVTDFANPQLKR